MRKIPVRQTAASLLLIVLFLLICVAGAVANGTFTFSSLNPKANAIVTTPNLKISTYVTSQTAINKNSARIILDGVMKTATFTQWYSNKDGELWYNATGLKDGIRQVEFRVQDTTGNTGSVAWQFTIRVRPVISQLAPANNTTHTTVSVIQAKVTDANDELTADNMDMTVNGEAVPVVYDAATGIVKYESSTPLPGGTYAVGLQATDAAGNSATASWSFTVSNLPPVFSSFSPASGVTVSTASPNISVNVSHDTSNLVQSSVQMLVNENPVTPVFTYGLTPTYQTDYKRAKVSYAAQNLPDGPCPVIVRVSNAAGVTGEASWSFIVALPPTISNLQPARSSVHNQVTEISAVATDANGQVNAASVRMKRNGVDVEQERISFNASTGKMTAAYPEGLAGGTQTVWLEVADMAGNKRTETWSFTVNATPPIFLNNLPGSGTTVSIANPEISVEFEDPDRIAQGTASMVLNGEPVPAQFSYRTYLDSSYIWRTDYTKGKLTYRPAALDNGLHTVLVAATDEAGNSGDFSWTFTVSAPTKILEITPAPNTSLILRNPVIDIDLYTNETLQLAHISLSVNGNAVTPTLTEMGAHYFRLTYQPEQWPDEETVFLVLNITPDSGLVVEKNWSYFINTKGEMPGTNKDISTCTMCHDGLAIKQQLCGSCHAPFELQNWQTKCFTCHRDDYSSAVYPHHRYSSYPHSILSDHELIPEQLAGCNSCHSRFLTREHNKNNMNCATCHTSQNATVMQAIDSGQKECMQCHTGVTNGHPEHKVSYGSPCLSCHGDSMITEKVRHNNDCATCHNSLDPLVSNAVKMQKDSCFDCHGEAHGVTMAVVRQDIPLYSGVSWGTPQDALIWSGDVWLPTELSDSAARVVFSSRAQLSAATVHDYYLAEMTAAGWILKSDSYSTGSTSFELTYQKDRRYCKVWLYCGDLPGGGGSNPQGSRLQIAYH